MRTGSMQSALGRYHGSRRDRNRLRSLQAAGVPVGCREGRVVRNAPTPTDALLLSLSECEFVHTGTVSALTERRSAAWAIEQRSAPAAAQACAAVRKSASAVL